jgi:hypothetical protein
MISPVFATLLPILSNLASRLSNPVNHEIHPGFSPERLSWDIKSQSGETLCSPFTNDDIRSDASTENTRLSIRQTRML